MPRCASHYQISQFIYRVFQASGLKRSQFIQGLGYRNITGGLRSLDRWLDSGAGDPVLLDRLVRTHNLDPLAVRAALLETEAQHAAEYEEARRLREQWERQTFRQSVLVETPAGFVQSSFTVAAIVAPALKTIRLPADLTTKPESDQVRYVSEVIRQHFADRGGKLPLFGDIIGYRFINSYDESFRFDTRGNIVGHHAGHVAGPGGTIQIGRKTIAPALLVEMFGGR
jgi:hypothetical protein